MSFLYQIFVVLLIIVIGSFVQQYKKRRKQPPGPLGLPFVGDRPLHILLHLFPKLFPVISQNQYFIDMKNKYGDIWSTDLGDRKIVVLSSLESITEAFVDNWKYFQGGKSTELFKLITTKYGILFVEGEIWNTNRQWAVKSLRDLGMGKRQLESQINEEVNEMMEIIERNSSGHISCPELFIKPVSNVTFQLIFNQRSKEDDMEFEKFEKDLSRIFNLHEANVITFIPHCIPMKYIKRFVPQINEFIKRKESSLKFVEKLCKDRIKIESEFLKPGCVFDYFWRYRYQDCPDVDYEEKLTDITYTMFDLLAAGIDTSSNFLSFCCLLLGKYRDVQVDLRKELQLLVDDQKLINMEMRKSCPKLLSFVDEIHRVYTLGPRIFRRVVSNCMFRNYEITTDDIIFGDIHAIFNDPALFEDPKRFDPYRFLDKTRTKYTQNKNLIAFGIGKRICLGESLALMEIFLFLSRIVMRYDISLPKETEDNFDNIMAGSCGIVHSPLEHEIIFKIYNP